MPTVINVCEHAVTIERDGKSYTLRPYDTLSVSEEVVNSEHVQMLISAGSVEVAADDDERGEG